MDPKAIPCPHCGTGFTPRRSNQKYCSDNCRKGSHQKKDRAKNPKNSAHSPTTRQDTRVLCDTAFRLAEMLHTAPQGEQLGFMKDLIDDARAGNQVLRNILTNQFILKAGEKESYLFYMGLPRFPTITKAADMYCRKYWNATVRQVVKKIAPEPETGEVVELQTPRNTPVEVSDRRNVVITLYTGVLDHNLGSGFSTKKVHIGGYLRLVFEAPHQLVA